MGFFYCPSNIYFRNLWSVSLLIKEYAFQKKKNNEWIYEESWTDE